MRVSAIAGGSDRTTGNRRARWGTAAMLAPVLLVFIGVYLLPIGSLVLDSFRQDGSFTLAHHAATLQSAAFRTILWRTVTLSVAVTLLSLAVSYPLAYVLARLPGRIAAGLLLLVSIPYVTSILIRSYAWVVILAGNGIINRALLQTGLIDEPLTLVFSQLGTYIGMVQVQMPLMVFPLYAAMRRIDRSLVAAARILGSSPASAFWHVFLPLSVPGIVSGCTLVFLSCLGFYVTPALLGGPGEYLIAQGITVRVMTLADFTGAATQATLLLAAVLLLFVALRRIVAAELGAESRTLSTGRRARDGNGLRTWPSWMESAVTLAAPGLRAVGEGVSIVRRPVLWTATILALLYLVAPLLVVIPLAFSNAAYLTFPPPSYSLRWFNTFFTNTRWLEATGFSLATACAAALASLAFGVPAAFAIGRRSMVGRIAVYLLLISPLVVPHVVIAVALFFALASAKLVGTPLAFVLAYALLGTPYVVVVFIAGLRRIDRSLEMAAASLGATPAVVLRTVTMPLLLPTLVSALLFAFIVGFDDVVLGLFLSGPQATPLPIRMWDDIRLEISPQIAVVAVLLFAGLFVGYVAYMAVSSLTVGRRHAAVAENP